jgi:hypothetical protein
MNHCVQCHRPLREDGMSFEQRLVGADQWCTECWSDIMIDADLSYLDKPGNLSKIN